MEFAPVVDDVQDDGFRQAHQSFQFLVVRFISVSLEADLAACVQDALDAGARPGCAGRFPDDRQRDGLAVVAGDRSHAGCCTV